MLMTPTERWPDLVALELLVSVAETGSIRQAALRHHVSQPAASVRIRGLEAALGLRLVDRHTTGATLTPDGGAARGYYTAETEKIREGYNAWIRTTTLLDGVVDFDKVTRDPAHPQNFLPAYDSGDHLHPNDAGYQAMAEAIPLAFFGR